MADQIQRTFSSWNNPGWAGSGVPDLGKLGTELRSIPGLLLQGRFRAAGNRSLSILANGWNFYTAAGKPGANCPCCGWAGPAFLASGNWRAVTFQSRCPQCDSRSRHRGLTSVLPPLLANKPPGAILFFAPELILLRYLATLTQDKVITTDYYSNDVDFPGEDIQQLSFADHSFGLLLCNHVLEHVRDDEAALRECARVLAPRGIAVITVPGDFPTETTWYFDKPDDNGHFRHYGMDIVQKMRTAFRTVEWVDMAWQANPHWHIRKGDFAFICRK
jgi:hypothetical protein